MPGITLKSGCIYYYGNPAGYVEQGSAFVDPLFQSEELSSWLTNRNLVPVWTNGVFERLSSIADAPASPTVGNQPIQLAACRIWQLRPDVDVRMKFISYEQMVTQYGEPSRRFYRVVYEGYLETNHLEDIYEKFNLHPPNGFTGHSLSMSDVIELYDERDSAFYYIDHFGFQPLEHF